MKQKIIKIDGIDHKQCIGKNSICEGEWLPVDEFSFATSYYTSRRTGEVTITRAYRASCKECENAKGRERKYTREEQTIFFLTPDWRVVEMRA